MVTNLFSDKTFYNSDAKFHPPLIDLHESQISQIKQL